MDKTVLVTGSNKGIGFEIARQLGMGGFHVFLTARSKTRGTEAAVRLQEKGIQVDFIQLDVGNNESIKNAAGEFSKFNTNLDVLVNNAAILIDKRGIINTSYETFEETMRVNTFGPFVVIQSFLPFMSQGSRIINISSDAGSLAKMGDIYPAYSISKAALNAVTLQFSISLKNKGIAVNSVHPGWVETDMGGRNATRPVEKGAETSVWLATDAPLSLTGKFLFDKKEFDW